jgi:hypothetical protein
LKGGKRKGAIGAKEKSRGKKGGRKVEEIGKWSLEMVEVSGWKKEKGQRDGRSEEVAWNELAMRFGEKGVGRRIRDGFGSGLKIRREGVR